MGDEMEHATDHNPEGRGESSFEGHSRDVSDSTWPTSISRSLDHHDYDSTSRLALWRVVDFEVKSESRSMPPHHPPTPNPSAPPPTQAYSRSVSSTSVHWVRTARSLWFGTSPRLFESREDRNVLRRLFTFPARLAAFNLNVQHFDCATREHHIAGQIRVITRLTACALAPADTARGRFALASRWLIDQKTA